MQSERILVIGDSCKDVFVYCHCDRLCPEAPVPVLDITDKTENLGMAGNVHRNIESLCYYPSFLVCNSNFNNVIKTRYVEKKTNHMFVRIDSTEKVCRITDEQLRNKNYGDYAAVIISDYDKGFLYREDIKYITENHPLTFLDTKKTLSAWALNSTFIKINRKEYEASKYFIEHSKLKNSVIETIGSGGCKFQNEIYPVKEVQVKDLSGAGDSFLAGLVVKYLQSKDIGESLKFANDCATKVVCKMGVSLIND